eukprot:CAMPEP_0194272148 /NCGR_PEP_ID=MMETSP0169-20130528/5783_1 /TAXON_ID=218684 /ORGANISM="Corethron pennatum, Strain L29A3" /LENGTH=133 /DNA_ID=CAMNT_0039014735 /DNA_START=87 /DNA_END=488 /DNA_ORIENTATION=+
MSSRIFSILRMIPESFYDSSSSRPNSYAVISLWRQYFRDQAEAAVELEEEEKEQRSPPARGELASTALRGFVDEHYRSLASATPNNFNEKGEGRNERMLQMHQAARDADQQRLNNPNLSVPSSDGDEYLYLPQ